MVESLTATLRKAEDDGATTHRQPTRWYWWLATLSLVGLCVRVAYVLVSERHAVPDGDAFYFHLQANLIANGTGWFIDPLTYADSHRIVPGADHPPLWALVLTMASVVGAKSYLSQLLWACVVGTAGVVLTGLAGSGLEGPIVRPRPGDLTVRYLRPVRPRGLAQGVESHQSVTRVRPRSGVWSR